MIFATYRDTGYNVVLFLHIVAVLVAIAPAVVHPILFTLEQRRADGDLVALATRVAPTGRIYAIALVVAGVIGVGLVSMSDSVLSFGDTWVWVSILLWVALNAVLHAAMLPAERELAAGDTGAIKRIGSVGPVLTILIVALIFLMTVKPG